MIPGENHLPSVKASRWSNSGREVRSGSVLQQDAGEADTGRVPP